MDQVDRLEIPEYKLLMKGHGLRRVDEEYRAHEQAFLNVIARATRGKKNTPVYKRFKDFFDYEEAIRRVMAGAKHMDVLQGASVFLREAKGKKEK